MKYKLCHKTFYFYQKAVNNYQGILCLHPRNLPTQICQNFDLKIEPTSLKVYDRQDYFGNIRTYFSLHESHDLLKVIATSEVDVLPRLLPPISKWTCEEVRQKFKSERNLKIELLQYQLASSFIKWDNEIADFAETCLPPKANYFESIKLLCAKIFSEFQFKSGATNINTPLKTILKERKGVCQDFSHFAIACLRSLGFAARYVSGYLETLPPIGKPKLQGSDASHAWISVYVPDMGWIEFDPTNNLIPEERHIVTAFGRDYADVSPLKGIVIGSGQHKVKVEVDVIPL
jgi:transglutaminase-like putative cysteine protease